MLSCFRLPAEANAHTPSFRFACGNFSTRAGTGFHATRERKNQPSVETLMSLLYRCGAVSREGAVVTMFDRFSAWAEACMVVKLPCIMFVAGAPTPHVQDQVERLCAQGPS